MEEIQQLIYWKEVLYFSFDFVTKYLISKTWQLSAGLRLRKAALENLKKESRFWREDEDFFVKIRDSPCRGDVYITGVSTDFQ